MRLRNAVSFLAAVVLMLPLASVWAQGPLGTSSETVARPRNRPQPAPAESKSATSTPQAEEPAPAPAGQDRVPSKFRKKGGDQAEADQGDPLFKADVNSVTVDVAVLGPKGNFIPGIPRGNFRILEDGVPQKIESFTMGNQAPLTVAVVVEFSNLWQQYYTQTWADTLNNVYGFMSTLQPEDTVAVVAYDIRPEILSDFSTDRRDAQAALQRLNIAAFSESNLFDAITFTAQRMSEIQERKAILLISSGYDTFSKLNYGETRKILQRAGVPIYAISVGQAMRILYEAYGGMGPIARMDGLQADNQLRTFANETGGIAFFPRFQGEMGAIFQQVAQALRSQYTITYQPSNTKKDGSFRKIQVELIAADGTPLKFKDEKNKEFKVKIVAKQGYTAPREVE